MEQWSIQLKLSTVEKYPAKAHVQRVARQLGASDGHIYLLGQYNTPAEDSDMPPPWKQRRYFYYCSGVDIPNCCLVYRIQRDELILYIPKINPRLVVWMGRPPTIAEAKAKYDVDDVRHNGDLFDDLKEWVSDAQTAPFFILHPSHKPAMDLPNVDAKHLLPAIDRCRVIKDQYEINCIRRANDVTAKAHRGVLRNIRALQTEAQIQGLFEYTLTVNQQCRPAYATIAGSGPNAGILHYSSNNEALQGRQLVCLDAGAMWENYACDVTRTFPISGYFTPEARAIYELVELMQTSAIEALRPGVRMWDLHQRCRRQLVDGFLKLGLFHNGTADEIEKAGTCNGFFPHGLGHHLGLETHDVIGLPFLKYLSNGAVVGFDSSDPDCPELEEGMVITIEPGVYFNRYELERAYLRTEPHCKYIDRQVLDRYWDVGGVRIEDDLVITARGYENLTTAPKGNEALELIRTGPDGGDGNDVPAS